MTTQPTMEEDNHMMKGEGSSSETQSDAQSAPVTEATASLEWSGLKLALDPAYCPNTPDVTISRDLLRQLMAGPTDEQVGAAMEDAWDEICADTNCHPIDIDQVGRRRLEFSPRHWADLTATRLRGVLAEAASK